jgi:hypothetical protein
MIPSFDYKASLFYKAYLITLYRRKVSKLGDGESGESCLQQLFPDYTYKKLDEKEFATKCFSYIEKHFTQEIKTYFDEIVKKSIESDTVFQELSRVPEKVIKPPFRDRD